MAAVAELKALTSTKIYILDKPEAAQSVLVIGNLNHVNAVDSKTSVQIAKKIHPS